MTIDLVYFIVVEAGVGAFFLTVYLAYSAYREARAGRQLVAIIRRQPPNPEARY